MLNIYQKQLIFSVIFLRGTKQKEEFKMKESIDEAVLAINSVCNDKNIAINIQNECHNFKMHTFKDGLIQALINILTNAKEALLRKNTPEAKINIFCYEDPKTVYIKSY